MYLLQLNQGQEILPLAVFESLDQGRAFISQLEGYEKVEDDGFIEEYLQPTDLPDYLELQVNGNRVPFSRWMFPSDQKIFIDWLEIPNLSLPDQGLVVGATRVDAYSIDNQEVKAYIEARETTYSLVKSYLQGKGFEVSRDFKGSEDGEAILYRHPGEQAWSFLCHLDPYLVEDNHRLELIDEFLES